MAIGKNVLVIDGNDFVKGMSVSEEFGNAGFSPETTSINITKVPGAIYSPSVQTDASTNLTDEIIASCEDPTYLGEDRMFLDDTGNLYSWSGTTLTKEDNSTADEFTAGTSDMIPFYDTSGGLGYYLTTKAGANGDIMRWNGSSTLDEAWWTSTKSQSALSAYTPQRPLLVYENYMFIGDKNKLHRVAKDLTISNGILELPYNDTITALGIDQGSGKMLIATNTGANWSATQEGKSKILLYDGFSNKVLKVIPFTGLITAFKEVSGTIFVFYQNKVGYWNGSGVTFLRELDIDFGGNTLTYKHHITSIDDTLYIAEGKKILAFGPTLSGVMAWYYVREIPSDITMLTNIGGNKLGVSYATAKFKTLDVTAVAGTGYFYSNKYILEREVNIREIVIYFVDGISAGADGVTNFTIIDDKIGGQGTNLGAFTNETAHATWKLKKIKTNIQTSMIQVRFNFKVYIGVKRIEIKYDVAK